MSFHILVRGSSGGKRYGATEDRIFSSQEEARVAVHKLCKEYPDNKYSIMKLMNNYWLDPDPKVLSDEVIEECVKK